MQSHQTPGQGHSEPQPFPAAIHVRLAEELEDSRDSVFVHADSRVADLDDTHPARALGCLDRHEPTGVGELCGVLENVLQNLR